MNDTEKAQEVRKQKRLERLGSNNPVCIACGENDWRCLEQHHIAGQAFGDDLCNICRNCHRKLSDSQIDHPKQITSKPTTHEYIGHFLLGLADIFGLLLGTCQKFGHLLINGEKDSARLK